MKAQTVALIGLDRVTGSIALALREAELGLRIIGHDPQPEVSRDAGARGIVDESRWNLPRTAAAADILVLSLSRAEREQTLRAAAPELRDHALVVDLSGGKSEGQAQADALLERGHYVGARALPAVAHMLDGRQGLEAADAGLLRDGLICLAPSPAASSEAVESAVRFGLLLGARPFYLDAAELDRLAQGVDAMPGLLGAALFHALSDAAGWRDMVRVAGTPFALATAALAEPDLAAAALAEREATVRWIDAVTGALREVRRRVVEGDAELLEATLHSLALERELWLAERRRNEWEETLLQDAEPLTMRERLLGSRRQRDE